MKAIIYTRVSTDEQADKGFSLSHQKVSLKNFCKLKDIHVVKHFQEDYSAKTFDRPEWKKLETFVSANKRSIDAVYFTRWDRFSRNAPEAYQVLAKFRKMGVELNSIEQPLDTENPDSKVMLAFYLAIPEVENDKISIRVTEGTRRALKDGYFVYKAPIGYRRCKIGNHASIEPDPKTAPIIQYIFKEYSSGIISQDELRIEVRRKFGIKISKTNLMHLLKRETYLGKIKVKAYKNEPEQIVDGLHESLIDQHTFDQVQQIISGKAPFKTFLKTAKNSFPLRGHLQCPQCGNKLTASKSKGKNKYYSYYHCQNGCKERVSTEVMHQEFQKLLRSLSVPDEQLALFKIMLEEHHANQQRNASIKIRSHTKEIAEIELKIEEAEERLFEGKISQSIFDKVAAKYKDRVTYLKSEVEFLSIELEDILTYYESAAEVLQSLDQWFDTVDLDGKKRILCSIFPENLIFEKNRYRTPKLNELICVIHAGMPEYFKKMATKKGSSNEDPYCVDPIVHLSNTFIKDIKEFHEIIRRSRAA